jgi:hypothetical protein
MEVKNIGFKCNKCGKVFSFEEELDHLKKQKWSNLELSKDSFTDITHYHIYCFHVGTKYSEEPTNSMTIYVKLEDIPDDFEVVMLDGSQ